MTIHKHRRLFGGRSLRSLLTREGEVELARKIAGGGPAAESARRLFIESNQGLVIAIAGRYLDRGFTLSDLVQEGNLGLIRAVDSFDHTRGYRFSTFAVWWVRQAITRALSDKARTIRLPVHVVDARRKIRYLENTMQTEAGEVNEGALATAVGFSKTKLARLQGVVDDPISMSTPLKDQDGRDVADLIADQETPSPHEVLLSRERSVRTLKALSRLTDKERRMIRLRFGIGTFRPHTLEEIGQQFGVTRERVRQIEAQALAKLRGSSESAVLASLLD